MHRKFILISGGLLVALCAAGLSLRDGRKEVGTRSHPRVEAASPSSIVIGHGIVEADRSVEVKSRVSGRLSQLLVNEGDQVVTGQLLAVVHPQQGRRVERAPARPVEVLSPLPDSTFALEQPREAAKAAVAQAKARVAQLKLELEGDQRPAAAVAAARSALRRAQEERQRLVNSVHPAQKAAAFEALAEAKENAEAAETEYQRQVELEKEDLVAIRSVQSAKLASEVAKARLASAQRAVDRLDAQFAAELAEAETAIRARIANLDRARGNPSQIAAKREDLKEAEAELARAEANLATAPKSEKSRPQAPPALALGTGDPQPRPMEIRAPTGGIVTKRVALGPVTSASAIMRIEDRSRFLVRLKLDEGDAVKLQVGMRADVRVATLPGKLLEGKVTRIAPVIVRNAGPRGASTTSPTVPQYQVEVSISAAQSGMRSGMAAKCTIRTAQLEEESRPRLNPA